ncbi:ParB/RepB/Spo0J family partition protein [Streptomyces cavernae]|uniref:ParB/RepB/Spo0J family partition protein n=1 Tax=Streptomyces cavernae TaxID=2259034 RepID=UPI000FEB7F9B|nr:ParB/RepB/Spo0J family partition protein [Streptomyces cavernae]
MPAVYLETRDIPIADLTPFPGNAKKGDVAAIRDSLRRNGQYRSLIVRKAGKGALTVLAGNHTMQALAAEGAETARCEVITCDDQEAKRINLADNRLSELGTWDEDALAALLKDVQDDLDGTGYSSDDLDELLQTTGELAANATEFLTDFVAPAPASPAPAAPAAIPGAPAPAAAIPGAPGMAEPAQDGPEPQDGVVPPPAPLAPAQPYVPPPPVPVPTGPLMTPVQWVVTVEQRDTIRAAIKHAQEANGLDNSSAALTEVCRAYLEAQENPS